ncbi:hypothetical protein CPB85DRAFT_1294258 [Mucidula mucida]|nr:hypothetical protein CPB85DRAFT_1294258 [Mucidula mucida]
MVMKEIKGLGEGSEKEIEGFFNLIYSHILSLYPPDSPTTREYITALLQTISSAPASHTSIKYRILSNLFNALPRTSSLRYLVYTSLLDIALQNNGIHILHLSQPEVEKWLDEWEITAEEKSAFLRTIVDAYTKAEEPASAYSYSLAYVRSLPATSDEGKVAAVDAIAAALRLPSVFDFDPLFKLDAVVASKDHELFSLLQVFLNGGLSDFSNWLQGHAGAIEKYNLEVAQLERKIRLLTLASLGFQKVGQNVQYSQVAETLQVDVSEVEKWVIDVIRAGLMSAKLSQTTQSIHIIRSNARTFERQQWEVLEKRLLAWKAGLAGVLDVVATARQTDVLKAA